MESIVGLSVTMLVLATLVMAIGAALQAAVGLGMALFVVLLLALIDVRLIPGLCCSHRWRSGAGDAPRRRRRGQLLK